MRKVPKEAEGLNLSAGEKVNNFWYYNKWKMLFCCLLAVIIGISVYSCYTKPKYDCTVVVALSGEISETSILKLSEVLTDYCEDYNGDGKVQLNVYNCSFTDSSDAVGGTATSHYTNFVASFLEEENMIYIIDKEKIDYVDDDSFMDSTLSLPDLDGRAFKLNGTDFETECRDKAFLELTDDTYIVRRSYEGAITKKKNAKQNFDNAAKFINRFVAKYKTK